VIFSKNPHIIAAIAVFISSSGEFKMASVSAPNNATTQASTAAAADITSNTTGSNQAYMALLDQSTAQTLQIQTALLNHNLTVGPVMAAKSASEDAKKT
jgi:hypothetical protein